MFKHGKYFYAESHLNGLVMELEGGQAVEGVRVVMGRRLAKNGDHQLFFVDTKTSSIRCKLEPTLCLDGSSGQMKIMKYTEKNMDQKWTLQSYTLQNCVKDHVADVDRKDEREGTAVLPWWYHGESNQHWTFVFEKAEPFTLKNKETNEALACLGADKELSTAPEAKVGHLWFEDSWSLLRNYSDSSTIYFNDDSLKACSYNSQLGDFRSQWWLTPGGGIRNKIKPDLAIQAEKGAPPGVAKFNSGATAQTWVMESAVAS